MHCQQRFFIEQPSGEARLIAGYRNRETSTGESRDCRNAAIQRQPLINRFYELAGVLVDHAIAIEYYEPFFS